MTPKPLRQSRPKAHRPAMIYVQMWAKPGRRLWVYHDEEKMYFRRCEDARQWASKQGFDGVKFLTEDGG